VNTWVLNVIHVLTDLFIKENIIKRDFDMAFNNGFFRGSIGGKTILDYKNKLDYNIESLEERKDSIKELLSLEYVDGAEFSNEEFWNEIWDMGVCKAGINTDESLWSETNVCLTLESMANYLLAKHTKDKKDNIKIYDSYELFRRAIQEQEVIRKHGELEEDGVIIFRQKKNYKLDPKPSVTSRDKKRFEEINDYDRYKDYLISLRDNKELREELADKLNLSGGFKMKSSSDVYRFTLKHLPLISDDMLNVKLQRERAISWKSPLRDSGNEIDWDYLDMFDKEHVKALLAIPKDMEVSSDVYLTVDMLVENAGLTDIQKDILILYRKNKTLQSIANTLGMSHSNVKKHLDKIVTKVINQYEKEYEEKHYYLNVVKGKYKKCNCCGEIKLLSRFANDSKGTFGKKSKCKNCTSKAN